MADKITQTNVLQITVQDTDSNRQSFNIENPREGITITQVRDIFAPIISSGKLYSRAGNPINYIEQATLTKTKKIELDDSGTIITVTPESGRATGTGTIQGTTFTVDGSPIKGYTIKFNESGGAGSIPKVVKMEIDSINNTITPTFNISAGTTREATISIITIAGKIDVLIGTVSS